MTDQEQSGYYQAIARDFLRRRGAAFFLSPRDLAVIAGWERDRIPLRVVLEGVARAFDGPRDRSRGTRGLPLSFCDSQVRKAMAQHADRGAGRPRSAASPRAKKAGQARKEAERCLRGLGEGDAELRTLLGEAVGLLAREPLDEPAHERIDEAVDELLCRRAPRADGERREQKSPRELAGSVGAATEAAARMRLVKDERQKHKVPYVSLYYY
jgi:hypothetical protein